MNVPLPSTIWGRFGHGGGVANPSALQRFVDAQDANGTYAAAVRELSAGRKTSHWMWFVFPQLRGLGRSPMAERYGIASRAEAVDYLAHDVLGPRLLRCAQLVVASGATTARELMGGELDALKLQSSMTLFAEVAGAEQGGDFGAVLDKYFAAQRDPQTLRMLSSR